ncbi:MAG: AAA family ATPase [Treponema sp.]|jgi:AAA15 family ATPase/GTPase|nr:AAA family ATPase [Treponema sp.]
MLDSLRIQNYKALQSLDISKLGRLNLVVGKNNSGKSTVLESIRILAAQGNPSLIDEIIISHDDEIIARSKPDFVGEDDERIDIYEGLFTNRMFPADGSPIFIGSCDKKKYIEIRRVFFDDEITETKDKSGGITTSRTRKTFSSLDEAINRNLNQTIEIISPEYKDRPLYLDKFDMGFYRRQSNLSNNTGAMPVSFVPTQFLSMDLLAELWDKTVLTDYFVNIKRFLKLISDNLEDIAFIKVNRSRYKDIERTGIVKLDNHVNPIPLNSMGDGIVRILQLVLGIYPAIGGILLIEEFENGLHFSIQEKLWELIFELAKTLDIQVFATTHSWDCIEAFTHAAEVAQDNAILIKISQGTGENQNTAISTIYEKSDLINLTQADVELR